MSKTRKITASKKNRNENGIRADDFGSKPHSNGEDFSRSVGVFIDKISIAVITTIGNTIASIEIIDEVAIILEYLFR